MDSFLEIFPFVGALTVLIVAHEFGHFIVARWLKVEVEEFGLGFPPRAMTLFRAGGTIFSLNWIPLGGFVRPKGENDPEIEGGLAAASPLLRLAVFAAGPLMNLLAGCVLYAIIIARVGIPDTTHLKIISVNENSPAERAGLQTGDIITHINAETIDSPQLLRTTIGSNTGEETQLTYQRGDGIWETTLIPRLDPPPGQGALGITYGHPRLPQPVAPLLALGLGGLAAYQQVELIVTLPARVIAGAIAPEDARLLGYKGMFDLYQTVRETDAVSDTPSGINTMAFFAYISISLALLNLLPIPALDGGRILFILPELILRRRLPPKYENAINLVSFVFLLLVVIYVNVSDFVSPAL